MHFFANISFSSSCIVLSSFGVLQFTKFDLPLVNILSIFLRKTESIVRGSQRDSLEPSTLDLIIEERKSEKLDIFIRCGVFYSLDVYYRKVFITP